MLPCLVRIEGKLRSEERHLRKEVQKMDGILKEVLTDEKETGEKGETAVVTAEKNSGPEESKKLDGVIVEESSGPNVDVVVVIAEKHIL